MRRSPARSERRSDADEQSDGKIEDQPPPEDFIGHCVTPVVKPAPVNAALARRPPGRYWLLGQFSRRGFTDRRNVTDRHFSRGRLSSRFHGRLTGGLAL